VTLPFIYISILRSTFQLLNASPNFARETMPPKEIIQGGLDLVLACAGAVDVCGYNSNRYSAGTRMAASINQKPTRELIQGGLDLVFAWTGCCYLVAWLSVT